MDEISEHLKIRLEQNTDLPSLPAVAVEILNLAQDSKSSMGDVAEVVSYDPALTSKIMKIANSPLYGQRRKSSNVQESIMVMGLNSTLMLTLSFSLFNSMSQELNGGLNYERFWRRSLLSSTAARLIALHSKVANPEDCFLAALLQDIGMSVLDRTFTGFYANTEDDMLSHGNIISHEQKLLKCDHAVIGAWLLERWNFPDYLVEGVAKSHQLLQHPELSGLKDLADVITLSGMIADAFIQIDQNAEELATRQQWLGDSFETMLNELHAEIPIVEGLFEMNILDGRGGERLLTQAKELMLIRGLTNDQTLNQIRREDNSAPDQDSKSSKISSLWK